jgi:hypothetical protein
MVSEEAATTGGSSNPHGRFRERRNSRGGKKHNNRKSKRQSFDGRMPELKGFTCDLKDAELSSGNRKVCKCISNGVVTLVSAR